MTTQKIICCSRCNQVIKNIVTIDGKPYGTDCAEVVLGIRELPTWFKGGDWNEAKAKHDKEVFDAQKAYEVKKQAFRDNWDFIKEFATATKKARAFANFNEFATKFFLSIANQLGFESILDTVAKYDDVETYLTEEAKTHYGLEIPCIIRSTATLSEKQRSLLNKLLAQYSSK